MALSTPVSETNLFFLCLDKMFNKFECGQSGFSVSLMSDTDKMLQRHFGLPTHENRSNEQLEPGLEFTDPLGI